MYETDAKTVGFGGGLADARALQHSSCSTPLVPIRIREHPPLASRKDARTKLQLRTGVSNCRKQMTTQILPQEHRFKLYAICALFALTISGVIPSLAISASFAMCDAFGWWFAAPLLSASCLIAYKAVTA